jgi:hypothetical protein
VVVTVNTVLVVEVLVQLVIQGYQILSVKEMVELEPHKHLVQVQT